LPRGAPKRSLPLLVARLQAHRVRTRGCNRRCCRYLSNR
jgi:hypothetical protein